MDAKKRDVVKDVIRRLHKGLGAEQARDRILREVGQLTSAEIAEIEQSLINEGVEVDEIKRFCNVHALLFEAALDRRPESAEQANPLKALREQNREIRETAEGMKKAMAEAVPEKALKAIGESLRKMKAVDRHYIVKENAIFPFLEKHGFTGPSQVMWAKHNDIRTLLRSVEAGLPAVKDAAGLAALCATVLEPLVSEVEGMVVKEEGILFPAAIDRFTPDEWATIASSLGEISATYAPASKEKEYASPAPSLAALSDGAVVLPSGTLSIGQLEAMLNVLPVDVSFVDSSDKVAYFNQTAKRIFPRSVSVIGRSVQHCHPPQSVHKVNAILDAFRKGERDRAEFWITLNGRFISIRYIAVRGADGKYLGCLEVSQDLTELRALQGERRLLQD